MVCENTSVFGTTAVNLTSVKTSDKIVSHGRPVLGVTRDMNKYNGFDTLTVAQAKLIRPPKLGGPQYSRFLTCLHHFNRSAHPKSRMIRGR